MKAVLMNPYTKSYTFSDIDSVSNSPLTVISERDA